MKAPPLQSLQPLPEKRPELAEFLLGKKATWPRGGVGRPWPSKWIGLDLGVDPARSLLGWAFFGEGLDHRLCLDLYILFHYRNHKEGAEAVKRILARVREELTGEGRPAEAQGFPIGFLKKLGPSAEAVRVPVDPNGSALALALVKLGGSAKAGDLVNEAENFFHGVETARQRDSLRASLFRSAERLLSAYKKLKQDPMKKFAGFKSQFCEGTPTIKQIKATSD